MANVIVDEKIRKMIIKYSVIISLFTFTVSHFFKKGIEDVADVFIDMALTLDLDRNGEPDLSQLKRFNINILGVNMAMGNLIYALLKLFLQLAIVYLIILAVIKYTSLVRL